MSPTIRYKSTHISEKCTNITSVRPQIKVTWRKLCNSIRNMSIQKILTSHTS